MFEINLKEFEQMPQTAEEFERWAMQSNNPIVRHAMRLHLSGAATREEVLLLAVWHLAKSNAESQERLYQRMVHEPITITVPPFVGFTDKAEAMTDMDERRPIVDPLGGQ
ncbi:MAG TPA: hypothetical protein VN256_13055 [Pyrinomonadaceae bacterium]|nr:hypothetical protein [Pyrinomonadaceae bacterium]